MWAQGTAPTQMEDQLHRQAKTNEDTLKLSVKFDW